MRILGISGSLRRGSHNRRLLRAAGALLPPGVELVEWDGLAGLPAFDEDLEDAPPEPFRAHVLSAEFFDAENHPEVKFVSTDVELGDDNTAKVTGELTIKGITNPVAAAGTWTAPAPDAFGNTRAHLSLETVIDRTQWDMNWNAPLPSGGKALANEVTLTVDIALIEQA